IPMSAATPCAASAFAIVTLARTCSRDGCDNAPNDCSASASSSWPSPACSSGGSVAMICSTPWSMARSVAFRAQNPSGSSGRSTLGTIVSQKARSTSRRASLRPPASIRFPPDAVSCAAYLQALHREDGGVVVLFRARELEQRLLDALNRLIGAGDPGERGLEALLAEAAVGPARVENAVGVEHEDVARFDFERGRQPVAVVEGAEQWPDAADLPRLTAADQIRQWVTGT